MSHYLGQCASLTGKNYFSNLVSVQQLCTLVERRRIDTNLGMSIKYHTDACDIAKGLVGLIYRLVGPSPGQFYQFQQQVPLGKVSPNGHLVQLHRIHAFRHHQCIGGSRGGMSSVHPP